MTPENRILPYFYPTSVALVDDDRGLLSGLANRLGQDFKCYSFSNPLEALTYFGEFNSSKDSQDVLPKFLDKAIETGQEARRLLEMLGAHISILRGREDRFSVPSVAIIDLSMPNMDGLTLCSLLRKFEVGIVLLTGTATPNNVIAAFNKGLIDGYVSKYSHDMLAQIRSLIHKLQRAYLARMSAGLRFIMSLETLSFVRDEGFQNKFFEIVNDNDIAEYYVRWEPAGIDIIDRSGRARIIIVLTEEELIRRAQIAIDNGACGELVDAMRSRSVIAYFPSHSGYYEARFCDSWKMHLHASIPVNGSKNWRITILPSLSIRPAIIKSVISYNQFKGSRFR